MMTSIRGHSYLLCDRDFSIIKRKLRKHDKIYSVQELTELIISSSTTRKFTVNETKFSEDLILNFGKWWSTYYKRNCVSLKTKQSKRNEKKDFAISIFSQSIYDYNLPECIKAHPFIYD